MITRRVLLKSTAAVAALTVLAPASAETDGPMRVVATFSILGDMVSRIGGEHVAVTTLVGPDGDTHVYSPTPAAARAVSEADILVVNGLGFEGWLDRLVEAANFDGVRVVATAGIDPITFEDGDGDDHDDGHGHEEGEAAEDHDDEHDELSTTSTTSMLSTTSKTTTTLSTTSITPMTTAHSIRMPGRACDTR